MEKIPPELFTQDELAERWGVSTSRVRDYICENSIRRWYGYWKEDIYDLERDLGLGRSAGRT